MNSKTAIEFPSKHYIGGIEYVLNTAGTQYIVEAIYHSEGRVTTVGEANYEEWTYEYTLKDHLGNGRVTFSDLDNNGNIDVTTEILQTQHYYPFGMVMEGNQVTQQGVENKYQYNGKEMNSDFGLDWLDYGARWYDASMCRFNVIDRFAEKYYELGGYHYVANNPINSIDVNGDSVWTTSSKEYTNEHGFQQVDYTIHMTIALFNISDADRDIEKIKNGLIKEFSDALTMSYKENGLVTTVKADIQVSIANSMDDVKETDHLLVLVDNGKSKGKGAINGIGEIGGQIAYTVTDKFWDTRSEKEIINTSIHELGHNLGLDHSWEDGLLDTGGKKSSNYMSYGGETRNEFSLTQIKYVLSNTGALGSSNSSNATNSLNQGLNYEYAKRNVSSSLFFNFSSNKNPWDNSVKKGDKIPKIVK